MENYIIPGIHDMDLTSRALGNRHYVLAHFWIRHESYRNYFSELKRTNPDAWITLDNSAAEKELIGVVELTEVIKDMVDYECTPNEVIPPDELGDMHGTLDNFYAFMEYAKSLLDDYGIKIFACPQGSTREEWLACYDVMRFHPRVSTIGLSKITVPRCFCNDVEGDGMIKEGRHACVNELMFRGAITKPLHFLGMGDISEYLYYKDVYPHEWETGLFRSTDSCYSVLAAVNGVDFEEQFEAKGEVERVNTTNDFYEHKLTDEELKLACKNIDFLSKILS